MKGMQGITAKPDTALGINKKLEGLALAFIPFITFIPVDRL